MATTEQRVDKLENRVGSLEQQVSAVTAKVDTFIGEMRDRDNQRVAEISKLRQQQDEDRKALESKIDRLGDKIQNMVIDAAFTSSLVFSYLSEKSTQINI